MIGEVTIIVWDVEHGACAMLEHSHSPCLAMIDSGHSDDWHPVKFLEGLGRKTVDYLFITNADQDHMSALDALFESGISVPVVHRSRAISTGDLRAIKLKDNRGKPLAKDIERYLKIHTEYTGKVSKPFDDNMGGVTFTRFWNSYPEFEDTNNLSMVVFFKYGDFKILFPGDMEEEGWLALLKKPEFVAELKGLDIMVAPHHGRKNGFCAEVFKHCEPDVVIFSDKAKEHQTQEGMTDAYYDVTSLDGTVVTNTGEQRWVLTTRSDGHIVIKTKGNGFSVSTENG